jgi:hypothetical protein
MGYGAEESMTKIVFFYFVNTVVIHIQIERFPQLYTDSDMNAIYHTDHW